ncbi:alpha/beta fold hydrolase [Shewanella sp.]|uniref:alpha/beta fold hydrolase n=1 Tax=Shewanella sp. TaxID=50422 RepID=UPI0040546869
MHFVVSGEGQAVVLIHGLFGDLDNLKSLSAELEKTHQVIRVDVPNHGLSEHWQQMDYPLLAEAIIQLLDTLGLASAHLVGHSMGGKIAMATALLYPQRIDSIVAADIAPVAYPPRHQAVFAGLTSLDLANTNRNQALNHLTQAGIDTGTAQFLLKSLRRAETGFSWKMNLDGLIRCYDKLIGWSITAKPYTKPCYMIRGGDSDYVTAEHKDAIMAQFPQVQAKTINGTGHWLHAQKPEIFNRLVADFIRAQT